MRQGELHGALDFRLLAARDIGADLLCMTLDRLAGYGEAGQKFQLFPTMIERGFAAHHRHHAAHRWGVIGIHDIQFPITRNLTLMAMRT